MSAATWLPSVLRTAGLTVVTYAGWRTRGRPGSFAPFGVLIHHTGTTTSTARPAPSVGFCITGSSRLTGPLCQVVVGFDGVMHVIAAGRANHAGTNGGSGPIPAGDGNAQMIGFEVDYSGSQDMGPLQYAAVVKASAAVLKHFGRDASFARGHKETSVAGKWDPGRRGSSSPEYRMELIRADIARALRPPLQRVRFELHTGEGKKIAASADSAADAAKQKERLGKFLAAHLDGMLAEFDHDRGKGEPEDVRIRRMWET